MRALDYCPDGFGNLLQQRFEVASQDAYAVRRAELIEKVAGSAAIALEVMYFADCYFFFISQVRTFNSFWLGDHWSAGVDSAIWIN